MGQCLRCEKEAHPPALFCDQCLAEQRMRPDEVVATPTDPLLAVVVPTDRVATKEHEESANHLQNRPADEIPPQVSWQPVASANAPADGALSAHAPANPFATTPIASLPAFSLDTPYDDVLPSASAMEQASAVEQDAPVTRPDVADQSLLRLSDAARLIASVETSSVHRGPRASRLSPYRDISAEIRRDSTPLPRTFYSTHPESSLIARNLPDWLQDLDDADLDGDEQDAWRGRDDPLQQRHFPSSSEIRRIEEDDRLYDSSPSLTKMPTLVMHTVQPRMRIVFIALTVLAIAALAVDSVLLSVVFFHNHVNDPNNHPVAPVMTLSSTAVVYGQSVQVRMRHFSPSTQVLLTRDVEEQIHLSVANPVRIDQNGSADVTMVVENDWDAGSHMIEAEDTTTRYTANATLQVDVGPTRPAHLVIDTQQLNLGADIQGANTTQPLQLRNSGGGSIVWSASSDQSWLLISPGQGTFSDTQQITVAVQRTNLALRTYTGKITFFSNVGSPQTVAVTMAVLPLPANVGAVLAVSPAVLTFTAVDGYNDPGDQSLSISNPGKKPLSWSLDALSPDATTDMGTVLSTVAANASWLSTDQSSGTVVPGDTKPVRVHVHSRNLLPGTYTGTLVFSAGAGSSALNSPEKVLISLTVQQRCGLTLNTGSLTFTAVSGQGNPANQALNLSTTASCIGTSGWSASSSASWLVVTPASGQLNGVASAVTTVSVNTAGLVPGTYEGTISLTMSQSAQSVMVQLVIQAPPPPSAPIIGASPLNLNFSTTVGQANPPGQTVTVANTGRSALIWHSTVAALAASWLSATPSTSVVPPGQSGQLTVTVNGSGLTSGTYSGQITLSGVDNGNAAASGSPQLITVNFVVLPACTLAPPTASALAFSATQGTGDPVAQTEGITLSGNCSWPVNWSATLNNPASWLKIAPSSGSLSTSGQSALMTIAPSIAGLAAGVYTDRVTITATDSSNQAAQGSPQTFTVTLTVSQPCALAVSATSMNFTVTQGQISPAQNLNFSFSGNCAYPVAWMASGDGASSWLVLSPLSGSSGSGSGGTLAVSADATQTVPGTYTGSLTISATGSGGAIVQSSPLTVTVSLLVTGSSLNGIAYTCGANPCGTQTVPTSATLTLSDSSGRAIATTSTDANGAFSFANVPNGTYTLSGTGIDGAAATYSGNVSVTVAGAAVSVTLDLYATQASTATGSNGSSTPTP